MLCNDFVSCLYSTLGLAVTRARDNKGRNMKMQIDKEWKAMSNIGDSNISMVAKIKLWGYFLRHSLEGTIKFACVFTIDKV